MERYNDVRESTNSCNGEQDGTLGKKKGNKEGVTPGFRERLVNFVFALLLVLSAGAIVLAAWFQFVDTKTGQYWVNQGGFRGAWRDRFLDVGQLIHCVGEERADRKWRRAIDRRQRRKGEK